MGPTIGGSADLPYGAQHLAMSPGSMTKHPKSLSTLGSHLCFFSRVEDQLTWIHGPTKMQTDVPTWQLQHIPTLHQAKTHPTRGDGSTGQREGKPTPPLGWSTCQVGPEASSAFQHATMHLRWSQTLILRWFNDGLIKGTMMKVTRIADMAPE